MTWKKKKTLYRSFCVAKRKSVELRKMIAGKQGEEGRGKKGITSFSRKALRLFYQSIFPSRVGLKKKTVWSGQKSERQSSKLSDPFWFSVECAKQPCSFGERSLDEKRFYHYYFWSETSGRYEDSIFNRKFHASSKTAFHENFVSEE